MNPTVTYPAFRGKSLPKSLFLEGILDIIPAYVFWKNAQSLYLGCTLDFAKLVGLEESDRILGKTDAELPWRDVQGNPMTELGCWDDDVLKHRTVIERKIAFIPPTTDTENVTTTFLLTKIPLFDKESNVIGLVGFFKGGRDGLLLNC